MARGKGLGFPEVATKSGCSSGWFLRRIFEDLVRIEAKGGAICDGNFWDSFYKRTRRASVVEKYEVWRAFKFSCLRGKGAHIVLLTSGGHDVTVASLPVFLWLTFGLTSVVGGERRAVKMRVKVWKKIQKFLVNCQGSSVVERGTHKP